MAFFYYTIPQLQACHVEVLGTIENGSRHASLGFGITIGLHFSKNFRYILLLKYNLRVSTKLQVDPGAVVRSGIYY